MNVEKFTQNSKVKEVLGGIDYLFMKIVYIKHE